MKCSASRWINYKIYSHRFPTCLPTYICLPATRILFPHSSLNLASPSNVPLNQHSSLRDADRTSVLFVTGVGAEYFMMDSLKSHHSARRRGLPCHRARNFARTACSPRGVKCGVGHIYFTHLHADPGFITRKAIIFTRGMELGLFRPKGLAKLPLHI